VRRGFFCGAAWPLPLMLSPLLVLVLAGCASAPPPDPLSRQWAQAMQRGHQALARDEAAQAEREYTRARWLAESIDNRPGRAEAVLSLAAAIEAGGRDAEALALLQALLAADEGLSPAGRVVAHGRAGALCLSLSTPECAQRHVQAAHALCAGTCEHRHAVGVLRARWALSTGQVDQAQELATQALAQLPAAAPTTEPTGRRLLGERANALRLLARVHLVRAQGAPAGAPAQGAQAVAHAQAAQAIAHAQDALEIDRSLGRAAHALASLDLLAEAHERRGDAVQAGQWRERAALARQAAARLGRRN
jgi:tetratricopeptide (TPR) repeat protein